MDINGIINNNHLPARTHVLDGLKILLADDDVLNVFIIKKILSKWHMEVSVAENGLIAVAMAKTGKYDVILMDVHMPVMDGLAASREIKKHYPDIPIIIVTSLPMGEIEENFNKIGVTEFVHKPVNMNKLPDLLIKYAPGKM